MTRAPDPDLLAEVRGVLRSAADPGRAPGMQAYMKSEMPFLGIARPALLAALRPVWAAHPVPDRPTWEGCVRALYDEAEYREERYAALALLERGRRWRDPALLPLLEHLIVSGAWWDLVDQVVGRTLAPLRRACPAETDPVLRSWSRGDDLWLRRASVLSQLGGRGDVDRDLLTELVLAAAPSREFFLRKAIGWALRDLAHHDPDWVRRFLDEHGDELSPLSVREAAKHL